MKRDEVRWSMRFIMLYNLHWIMLLKLV